MSGSNKRSDILPVLLLSIVNKREYEWIEHYVSSKVRIPDAVARALPAPGELDEKDTKIQHTHHSAITTAICPHPVCLASAIRAAVRTYLTTYGSLSLLDVVLRGILQRRRPSLIWKKLCYDNKESRQAASAAASIVLVYRTIYSVLKEIRLKRLEKKGPRASKRSWASMVRRATTSKKFPPFFAGLIAGYLLSRHPAGSRRQTIALYVFTRMLEFMYNYADDKRLLINRPWWFGSWLLFPFSSAQLLYTFVYDRDCFPAGYGDFILRFSKSYIAESPHGYVNPRGTDWPEPNAIVDAVATISKNGYPSFYSPVIYETSSKLPPAFRSIEPIVGFAHPAIQKLSCAVLHPSNPSCLQHFLIAGLHEIFNVSKIMTLIYSAFAIANYKSLQRDPAKVIARTSERIIRSSVFISMAITSAWASICFLQKNMPSRLLPQFRFLISGFLAGLWAFVDRQSGRGQFLYSTRLSLDSAWKVAVKHKKIKPTKNGDAVMFAVSMGVIMSIFERYPEAITGPVVRKSLSWLAGRTFTEPAVIHEASTNAPANTAG